MLLSTVSKSHQVSVPTSKVSKISMLCLLVGKSLFLGLPSYKIRSPTQHKAKIYFWFIPGSPEILSVETDGHKACHITAISPLQEWDSADHSPGCSHTMWNTRGRGRHVHRVERSHTTSWTSWSCQCLPAKMKEEDSPPLVKK